MSDLLVLHEMAEKNMDIVSTTTITQLKTVKAGGLVTIGVDDRTIKNLLNSALPSTEKNYVAVLYVIDYDQFKEIKSR